MVIARHPLRPGETWRQLGPAGSLALLAQLPVATLSIAAHPLGFPLLAQGDLHGALGAVLALGYGAAAALVWATSRNLWAVFMLPAYWCLHVAALVMAVHDVVRCPQHWFKTSHGVAARPAMTQREPATKGVVYH